MAEKTRKEVVEYVEKISPENSARMCLNNCIAVKQDNDGQICSWIFDTMKKFGYETDFLMSTGEIVFGPVDD